VLIVENDAVFRIPLRVALAVESYAVVAVVSAEAAETVLDHEAIDVVLTDLDLPDMDGAVLAARPPAVPFPLITGSPPDLAADGATAAVGEGRAGNRSTSPHLMVVLRQASAPAAATRDMTGNPGHDRAGAWYRAVTPNQPGGSGANAGS
jgi:CheY-like chemotaxis protein